MSVSINYEVPTREPTFMTVTGESTNSTRTPAGVQGAVKPWLTFSLSA